MLLDDPGRVRSHIITVVCKIRRFDFDYNLVVHDAKSNNSERPSIRLYGCRNQSSKLVPPLDVRTAVDVYGHTSLGDKITFSPKDCADPTIT